MIYVHAVRFKGRHYKENVHHKPVILQISCAAGKKNVRSHYENGFCPLVNLISFLITLLKKTFRIFFFFFFFSPL